MYNGKGLNASKVIKNNFKLKKKSISYMYKLKFCIALYMYVQVKPFSQQRPSSQKGVIFLYFNVYLDTIFKIFL